MNGHGIFYITNDAKNTSSSIGAFRGQSGSNELNFLVGVNNSVILQTAETTAPSVNTWNHYAFVISQSGNKIYKNGTLLLTGSTRTNTTGTTSTAYIPSSNFTKMYIGYWGAFNYSMGGSLKNLIFSKTAWSDANIASIYTYATDSSIGATSLLSSKYMMLNDNRSGLNYVDTNNIEVLLDNVQKINIKPSDVIFNNNINGTTASLQNNAYLPFTDSGLIDYYDFNDHTNLGLSGTTVNSTNLINAGNVISIESATDINSITLYKPAVFSWGDAGINNFGYLYNTSLTGKAVKTLFNQTAGITISFWNYYTSYTFNDWSGIFSVDEGSNITQFSLWRRENDGRLNIYVTNVGSPQISENPVPAVNTWNFYVIQFGSFGYKMYRNGIELTVANNGIFIHAGSMSTPYIAKDITNIYIGAWKNGTNAGLMTKYIKNFTLSSTLWTDNQIQNVYNYQGKIVSGSLSGKQLVLNGGGNVLPSLSSLYISPQSTAFSDSNNYYFNYLDTPISTGSTTGIASTLYIKGAPLNATTSLALYINSGDVRFSGGLSVLGGGMQYYSRISTLTTYTLTKDDYLVVFSAEDNVIVTLPLAANHSGRQYIIVKSSTSGSGQITVARSGSDFIDGTLTTLNIPDQYDRTSVASDGISIWYTI
jgi:hypothetical protein